MSEFVGSTQNPKKNLNGKSTNYNIIKMKIFPKKKKMKRKEEKNS
jgi:hypothetical protein